MWIGEWAQSPYDINKNNNKFRFCKIIIEILSYIKI